MQSKAIILRKTSLQKGNEFIHIFSDTLGVTSFLLPNSQKKKLSSIIHSGAVLLIEYSTKNTKTPKIQEASSIQPCQDGGYESLLSRDGIIIVLQRSHILPELLPEIFQAAKTALLGVSTKPLSALSWFCHQYTLLHEIKFQKGHPLHEWQESCQKQEYAVKDISLFLESFLKYIHDE